MGNQAMENFNIPRKFIVRPQFESLFGLITYCFEEQLGDSLKNFIANHKNQQGKLEFGNDLCDFVKKIYYNNKPYKMFLMTVGFMLNKNDVITVYAEPIYIDRIHRDSYYSFYSENHIEVSRYCKRLVFFEGEILPKHDADSDYLQKKFLGSMVIRPLKFGFVGRTLISPKALLHKENLSYIRLTNYKINFFGMELTVEAFPFLSQDGIVTTCAETSILIMMDYYSNRYNDYRYVVPSEISKIAQKYVNSRVVPSKGLTYAVISKILCEFGFFTYFHHSSKLELNPKIRDYLYYYVESGMPICINLSNKNVGHSVVCIGHKSLSLEQMKKNLTCSSGTYFTSTASGCKSLIVMDDNLYPYAEYEFVQDEGNPYSLKVKTAIPKNCSWPPTDSDIIHTEMKIDCFIAPLHKRMNMDAARAEQVILSLIGDEHSNPCNFFRENHIDTLASWGERDNPLIYRLFLASSRHYKQKRIESQNNITNAYRWRCLGVPLPQFVWICELYTCNGYENEEAIGEIIIDATASPKSDMFDCILMINYTYYNAYFARGINGNVFGGPSKQGVTGREIGILPITKSDGKGFLLKSYTGNLSGNQNEDSDNSNSPMPLP